MASEDRTPKTRPTDADVEAFLAGVPDEARRADTRTVVALMARVTGQPPRMWGSSIIGFGTRHYRYPTGREGDIAVVAVAPRKAATTLYLWNGFDGYADLLGRLGPHTQGKGCLYLKRVADVDAVVLAELVRRSYDGGTDRA
jgi:hypothetical protein